MTSQGVRPERSHFEYTPVLVTGPKQAFTPMRSLKGNTASMQTFQHFSGENAIKDTQIIHAPLYLNETSSKIISPHFQTHQSQKITVHNFNLEDEIEPRTAKAPLSRTFASPVGSNQRHSLTAKQGKPTSFTAKNSFGSVTTNTEATNQNLLLI